jgi:hypothetical protein
MPPFPFSNTLVLRRSVIPFVYPPFRFLEGRRRRWLEEEISNQETEQAKGSYDLERYTLLLLDVLGNVIDHMVRSLSSSNLPHSQSAFLGE